MHVFYTPRYYAEIGAGHVFPIRKFELVRDKLLAEGTLRTSEIFEPDPASVEDVLLVHTEDYVTRLCNGSLTTKEIRRLGLPWSESLVRRSFYAVGGTLAATHVSLTEGYSSNLAGGTHHSFPDHGEGFCVLNDVAIAVRAMRARERIRRAAIVDCDVHQGNGTAAILRGNDRAFTFSMHGARNFPFDKEASDLDIELADGTGDADYLAALDRGLAETFARCRPQLVIYLAGADPYAGDRLGRLSLSFAGLAERDERVLAACRERGIAVALAMAGGYAEPIADTVSIHATTILTAQRLFG